MLCSVLQQKKLLSHQGAEGLTNELIREESVAQAAGLSPFLDVKSFSSDSSTPVDDTRTFPSPRTPFLAVYELDEAGDYADPVTQEQRTFSAELHDDELDEAVYETIAESVGTSIARE